MDQRKPAPSIVGTTRNWIASLAFVALAIAAACIVLRLNPIHASSILVGHMTRLDQRMLWQFRLPRFFMTLMVGGGMALSGWAAQKATRNPLASPDILTVPAAAALGVMVMLWLSGGQMLQSRMLPVVAGASGTLAAALLFSLVGRNRQLDGSGLLLAGIAMGCLLSAATFLIALNAPAGAHTYEYTIAWMAGQLSRASWDYIWLLLPGWWLLSLAIVAFSGRIDILRFGDEIVTQLGGRPDRWRRLALCLSAALCAACVGVGGGFGFLGFLAPHLVRALSPRMANQPWAAAGMGALLLLAADAVGQVVMWPDQVPAGVVVSMLGAPCLVVFLLRRRIVREG